MNEHPVMFGLFYFNFVLVLGSRISFEPAAILLSAHSLKSWVYGVSHPTCLEKMETKEMGC